MSKIKAYFLYTIYALFFCACRNQQEKQQLPKLDSSRSVKPISDSSIEVYTHDGRKYLSFDKGRIELPINTGDSITAENIYDGIYVLRSDSLQRQKFMIDGNLVFFTTSEDFGMGSRGNLYVFDILKKWFIQDTAFSHDYLYSSAAVFVVDSVNKKIFAVNKEVWYEAKGELIIPASLYDINGKYFRFIRNVYEIGKEVPEGSVLLSFFKGAIDNKNGKVFPLPRDWWGLYQNKIFYLQMTNTSFMGIGFILDIHPV